MYPPDEVHTSFITDHANFCYQVMSFGLKNARATYQQLMDKVFHQKIGWNMEVYVDDMVVKTTSAEGHSADLAEVGGESRAHLHPATEAEKIRVDGPVRRGLQELQSLPHDSTSPPKAGSLRRPPPLPGRGRRRNQRSYSTIEKPALALVTAARRLRPYLQSHQVVVKTDYPIKQILRKPELAGRMIAWSVELSEFSIKYEIRGPLKAQCLENFVAELTPTSADQPQVWTLHVDGSSNSKGGGAGIILEGPNEVALEQSLKFGFKVTNNQAEYEALLARLRLAHDLRAWRASCNNDSKLMVEQLSGTYQTKDTLLQRYFHVASQQISSFEEFTIHHETLNSPSLDDKVVNTSDSEDQGWMTGIWNYLKEGILSEDKDKARKMRVRSAKFIIVGDELFKCDISTPLLKCLIEPQATYVIEEIHRGICGMHSDTRSMATRVLQAGYY
ncbi:uncharacterized protein LOC109811707 [Cajanus cajan]|uniref:uncharacterized protein LOC109811707 n=1 Tax=Cajanus cajan TaxID=3821 RepID=UPI00098D9401|nr:uncharacterized protein LOC109811707 [Cajanus cajan]